MGLIWPSMGIVLHTGCIWALDFPSDSYFGIRNISQLRRDMKIDYETIITLDIKEKRVLFFLKKGVDLKIDNLVDVVLYEIPKQVADNLVVIKQITPSKNG